MHDRTDVMKYQRSPQSRSMIVMVHPTSSRVHTRVCQRGRIARQVTKSPIMIVRVSECVRSVRSTMARQVQTERGRGMVGIGNVSMS